MSSQDKRAIGSNVAATVAELNARLNHESGPNDYWLNQLALRMAVAWEVPLSGNDDYDAGFAEAKRIASGVIEGLEAVGSLTLDEWQALMLAAAWPQKVRGGERLPFE